MSENRDIIRSRMLSRLSDSYDKNTGTFAWETFQSTAIEYENLQILLDDGLNQAFAGTADLEHLKVIAFEDRGIVYRDATRASGKVRVEGVENAIIRVGDIFESELQQYKVIKEAIIPTEGYVYVDIEAVSLGSVANTPINTITKIPLSISGVTKVNNEEAITNGFDEEGRESLLKRYYLQVRNPTTSGNINHYIQWATDVTGVGDVKIKPLWNGGGTVKVVILDQNKEPASLELIQNTKDYIETQRPIGADVTVVAPEFLDININVKIQVQKDYTLEGVKEDIKKNIEQEFKEQAFKSSVVYYAKVGNIIFNTIGVNNIDYAAFTINSGTADITLLDTNIITQVPRLLNLVVSE